MQNDQPAIYVVDDDASVRESLEGLLRSHGMRARSFDCAKRFLDHLPNAAPGLLILDLELPGLSGLELQRQMALAEVEMPTIFLSGHHNTSKTVRAIKAGALDFLTKPFDVDELLDAIREGLAQSNLPAAAGSVVRCGDFVGESPALQKVMQQIDLVADTEATVLVTGESGTGKELVARALHEGSRRRNRPLIKVNCAAIPEALFESEFFGHVRGAFTGAMQDRPGRFELAQGGTIFLDEIGEMPLGMQVKLLRALQEREIERVGETRARRVDVRVVAATNRNLQTEVVAGRFRQDLFYRLNIYPIHNPPLRERPDDIPRLVRHFSGEFARRSGKRISTVPQAAMDAMRAYPWPGNVRELQNFIERAVILSSGKVLRAPVAELLSTAAKSASPAPSLVAVERDTILQALQATHWRVGGPHGAAMRLGLKRTTLISRMEKLGIDRSEPAPSLVQA